MSTLTTSHPENTPVDFEVNEHGVGTITLNNPKRRNVLSRTTLEKLNEIVDGVTESKNDVRVVVLQSTGPVFSSGHDFKEFTNDKDKSIQKEILELCTELNMKLQLECPPTIAAVAGLATAAGCQLACSCDIVFATRDSRFCVPGSRNGGFCHTPGVALSTRVHHRHALTMLLLGDEIDAHEAYRIGLVSKLSDSHNTLMDDVMQAANKIARTSAHNTQAGKVCFYRHVEENTLENKYKVACPVMLDMFASNDQQEGIKAFFEKRSPVWVDS